MHDPGLSRPARSGYAPTMTGSTSDNVVGAEPIERRGPRPKWAAGRFANAVLSVVYPPTCIGDRLELARALGGMMARSGAELLAEAEVIVPVPLHRWRL